MKCPQCGIDLLMAERAQIPVDYCPQCRGIWLEKGKLEKFIGSASSQKEGPDLHYVPGGHHDDDYDHRRHKRRRSFLDLFD